MIKASIGSVIGLFIFFVVLKAQRGDELPSFYSWDFVALIVFFGFLALLLRERGGDETTGHEGANKSFLFRLGKALNGVRRAFK